MSIIFLVYMVVVANSPQNDYVVGSRGGSVSTSEFQISANMGQTWQTTPTCLRS